MLVKTNFELDKIKKQHPKYDPYFIASASFNERRRKFESLWKNYAPYADVNFRNQVKISFHQRSWEMYVGNVLLKKNLNIKSKKEGPDFIVGDKIYIECVAPTKGDPKNPNSVPDPFIATSPDEMIAQPVPDNQMILRISQVIHDKGLDQYQKWKNKAWFKADNPFILTINVADLGYVEEPEMPNVIKTLFGFESLQINLRTGKSSYSARNEIKKSNDSSVPVRYFLNSDFNFLSGVLFSEEYVLSHPENLGDDCFFVNNPFAINPVEEKFISCFRNWKAHKTIDGLVSVRLIR